LFLLPSGTAPVVPFIPVFARQLGYSPSIVGFIYFVLPIVGMLAKPIFGLIADRFKRQKFLFLLFQFVIVISFASILLIPAIPSQAEFHCHEGEDLMKFCPPNIHQINQCMKDELLNSTSNSTFNCRMECRKNDLFSSVCGNWSVPGLCESKDKTVVIDVEVARNRILLNQDCFHLMFHNGTINNHNTTLFCPGSHKDNPIFKMNCGVRCHDETVTEILSGATDDQAKSTYQFWTFFMLLIISWAGMAVVVSVGDAICFEMLGDKPQRYGHQRLWGSVGWGSFSIISGLLIDKFSDGQAKNYAVGFYIMAILILLDMAVSSKLNYSQTKLSSNILRDVGQIFTSIRVVVFFLWCIVVGLGTAMVWNFLFWHLEDLGSQYGCDYGSTMKTLQGLVMGIQCFGGELPFFFISGKLLKKIGHVNAMSLVLLGFGVRFFCYSVLTNPWYVLPIELLNGVTFGVFYATMASYASIVSPPGTEATMQVNHITNKFKHFINQLLIHKGFGWCRF
jgi:MFS family permease